MTTTREAFTAHATRLGLDPETTAKLLADMDDDGVAAAVAAFEAKATERADLKARLTADTALRQAVCPGVEWKTADDRFEVARHAVRFIDANADKHDLTPTQLAQALIDTTGTIADTIAMHGGDPRTDDYHGSYVGFYAFRCRIRDAIEHANADKIRAERQAREAAREAVWAAQGLTRCDRCGGAGGANHWPGFTCYDCGGSGALPTTRRGA